MWTLRRLSQRDNGVLSADDQRDFDVALREVMQAPTGRLQQSLRRFDRDRADALDPELRRSYLRTRARLEAQAGRARSSFPQLSTELEATPPESSAPPDEETEPTRGPTTKSLASFETEIEEASDSLVLLERIASIEQQQLEHHRAQALRDVRGVYFAVVVSVAVIVSGVAPLVEAEPSQRLLILGWTALVCLTAGLVYAVVRAAQSHRDSPD